MRDEKRFVKDVKWDASVIDLVGRRGMGMGLYATDFNAKSSDEFR